MSVATATSGIAAVRAGPRAHRRLAWVLVTLMLIAGLVGLVTGSAGFSLTAFWSDLHGERAALIIGEIRAPRCLGAALVGALLGLGGALAQGVFRNELADPYLLGSAAGACLAVVMVFAAASFTGHSIEPRGAAWLQRLGLVGAAFVGAVAGVGLTLTLAQGTRQPWRLLLSGVVVAVLLRALNDLVTLVQPDALRGKQAFMLGSTSFLGWNVVGVAAAGLLLVMGLTQRYARALDALTLGEETATSLGLDLARVRLILVVLLSLATALAVAHVGLVAFVGLAAPHLARRHAPGTHAWLLRASAAIGATLLLAADVVSRGLIPPQELPVGVITAVVGGAYLLVLLKRKTAIQMN
ncbi:MAG TPA: iron ABC transporter permease [Burkholderiaceae bacterium]|nr:iron ABC transporter permease [Burkholderiaceae bacterium]